MSRLIDLNVSRNSGLGGLSIGGGSGNGITGPTGPSGASTNTGATGPTGPAGSGVYTFTGVGVIQPGDPVGLIPGTSNVQSYIQATRWETHNNIFTSPSQTFPYFSGYSRMAWDSLDDRGVFLYSDNSDNTFYLVAVTMDRNGAVQLAGVPVDITASLLNQAYRLLNTGQGQYVIIYHTVEAIPTVENYHARGFTVDPGTLAITMGVQANISSASTDAAYFDAVYNADSDRIALLLMDGATAGDAVLQLVEQTGLTFTVHSATTIKSAAGSNHKGAVENLDGTNIVTTVDNQIMGVTIDGPGYTTVTTWAPDTTSVSDKPYAIAYMTGSQSIISVIGVPLGPNAPTLELYTRSGTTLTHVTSIPNASIPHSADTIIAVTSDPFGATETEFIIFQNISGGGVRAISCSTDGVTVSFGTEYVSLSTEEYASLAPVFFLNHVTAVAGGTNKAYMILPLGLGNSYGNNAFFSGGIFMTANDFIGISKALAADGDPVPVDLMGSINSNQTGLTPGTTYYFNESGVVNNTGGVGFFVLGRSLSPTEILIKIY